MKAHRTPPEYTIMEDDAEMIAQLVQDRTSKDFENVVHAKGTELKKSWKTCDNSSGRSGKHRQPTTT
jgi:hypothetical protein